MGNCKYALKNFIKAAITAVRSSRIPLYSSKHSKHTFTQHQHLVLLLLKTYLGFHYRFAIEVFSELTRLFELLKLQILPHFTTLQKFFQRFSNWMFDKMLADTIKLFDLLDARVAIDASGYSSSYASRYYSWRISGRTTRKSFMKDSITIDIDSQVILANKIRKSPRHDNIDFKSLVKKTKERTDIILVVADKGYDDESNHKLVRKMKATSMIPVRERKHSSNVNGYWRKRMKEHFNEKLYHKRNIVETVNSVKKRVIGDILHSRSVKLQKKETMLHDIVYNLYRYVKLTDVWILIFI